MLQDVGEFRQAQGQFAGAAAGVFACTSTMISLVANLALPKRPCAMQVLGLRLYTLQALHRAVARLAAYAIEGALKYVEAGLSAQYGSNSSEDKLLDPG